MRISPASLTAFITCDLSTMDWSSAGRAGTFALNLKK
jgi:hypothetical protein